MELYHSQHHHHQRLSMLLFACILLISLCCPMKALEQARTNSSLVQRVPIGSSQVKPKGISSDAIELLLEEISQLKLQLIPESAKQIKRALTLPSTTPAPPPPPPPSSAPSSSSSSSSLLSLAAEAAPTPGDPKTNQIKKRSNSEDKEKQQQQQQQQQPPQLQPQPQPQQKQRSVANSSETKTVCDESIAVATLGYRMLCRKLVRPKSASTDPADMTHASPGLAPDSLSASSPPSSLSSLSSLSPLPSSSSLVATDEGNSRDWQQAETDTTASVESDELARLKNLLDKLIRNGNFRSISTASSPTVTLLAKRR